MPKIHHIRNATMIVETVSDVILVDPMLGEQGSLPPFAFLRHKARRNPTVPLPADTDRLLEKVTHCLITHRHPDHLDGKGLQFLRKNATPITCSIRDEGILKKKGLNVVSALTYHQKEGFLGGSIEGIPARHGYGLIAKAMGNVMGFYIQLPNQKSIYLSSDTIYTDAVNTVLKSYRPDISVLACGTAQFDVLKKLFMHEEDLIKFVQNSNGIVIANHLEAINHCPMTRKRLAELMRDNGLSDKMLIPRDGESMDIEN